MRKSFWGKMLAVVLTLAICASTVLGCLMTATAAQSCYSFGKAKFPSANDLSQATIDVTFTAPAVISQGITAGTFVWKEVNADSADYLVLTDVNSKTSGYTVTMGDENSVVFETDDTAKTQVVLEFVFDFSKGNASKERKYKIQLNEIELAYSTTTYTEATGLAMGEISATCQHVVSVQGEPVINEANNYSVYPSSVCTLCGEEFGLQFVPTAEKLQGGNAGDVNSTIQWDGTSKTAPTEGSGTETDPYIISEVSHLAYITEAGPDVTHGKFFKVKDGIKNIVLQKAADADTLINIKSAEEAKTYLSSLSGRSRWNTGKYDAASAFCGTFDGNGATIYGLSADTSINISLFGSIGPKAEFKNLSIKNSFVQTGWYAAILAHTVQGYTLSDGTAVSKGTVKIDNCVFAQNYINPQSGVNGITNDVETGNQCVAVILGNYNASANGSGLAIHNVYTYDNITFYEKHQKNISPLIGAFYNTPSPTAETETEYCELMDSVLLGLTGDILVNENYNFKSYPNVQNIYTDSPWPATTINNGGYNINDAKTITKAEMLGKGAITAAPNLKWGKDWFIGAEGELPTNVTDPNFTNDTIYWDGTNTKTAPTVGGGTKDNPYIISTVAELAYIFGQLRDNYAITDGKYYKLADGIKNIVMQPYAYGNDIMALDSAADTKAYFEANAANMKQWFYYGWEGSTFCGNIDFGGATVYGIYQVSSNNAGFISNVDAGAVVSNLAIKNSYMKSMHPDANYQCGAIVANTNQSGYGKKTTGIIWFNNCTVANNYLYGNSTGHDRNGVIIGSSSDVVYIDNCLVYGNDATYGSGVTMSVLSSAYNSLIVSDSVKVPEGLKVVDDGATTDPRYNNMVRNSIILGAKPYDLAQGIGSRFNDPNCYENVYTDSNVSTDKFPSGNSMVLNDQQIKTINASDALGAAAETAMPNLAWGSEWYTGAAGEFPVQAIYAKAGVSATSSPELALVGYNLGYNDDGSFDFNLHYVPAENGVAPKLYVSDADCTKHYVIEATKSSKCDQLGANALMYTLPNISAKDINKVWVPTLISKSGALVTWGRSQQVSIADNAKAVIEGNYNNADKNVSAAILNYGAAAIEALAVNNVDYNAGTIDLLEFGQYLVDNGSWSPYYDSVLADEGETGSSWEDPIIIDSAEEFVFLAKDDHYKKEYNATTKNSDYILDENGQKIRDYTVDKYFKVADGIAGFDLSRGNLDYNASLEENLAAIQAGGKNHAGNAPGFQGHFDGNGITVYGAWTNHTSISPYAGLFSCTFNEVSIKNVHVKLASFTAKNAAGGIIGYHAADELCTVTIENCSVTDSYFEVTTTGYNTGVGAILGLGASAPALRENNTTDYNGDGDMTDTIYRDCPYIIKNCYVNLDEDNFVTVNEGGSAAGHQVCHGGVIGVSGSNAAKVSNCVVIGITPYATSISTDNNAVQHSGLESHFENVYTTSDVAVTGVYLGGTLTNRNFTNKVYPLTKDQLTGISAKDNMPALDWNNVWTTTNGYPTFINNKYEAPASGRVIAYTGSSNTIESVEPTVGSGTKDDPIIINTVQELAWVVGQTAANVAKTNKYFKVADGISAIVLQKPEYANEIMALSSAAETKAYFEANASKMVKWKNYGWEGSTFAGNIDFNGATVYGIYQVSSDNAGLFSTIEAGAVISNFGIKNSYITSSNTSYNVGAIGAYSNGSGYASKINGIIWAHDFTVANNYIYGALDTAGANDRVGVLFGSISDCIYIDNALVYGNDATYGANGQYAAPLLASCGNAVPETAPAPEGLVVKYSGSNASGRLNVCALRDSIIFDCKPYDLTQQNGSRFNDLANGYENVYVNTDTTTDKFSNGTIASALLKGVTVVSKQDAFGAGAKEVMPNLAWDDVWFVGAAGDVPGFKPAGAMPSGAQTIYDVMQLTTTDNYGESTDMYGVYSTGLNLKANPYMTFTFAFTGAYKQSADVKITFKAGGKVIETVTAADMINNDGAGRYHLYRLKSAPITALATGITVEASYNGVVTNFGTYSAEGFALQAEMANKIEPCDYYATRYEAAKALLFYSQMLNARYGA